jgi:hypothetical protein
VPAGHPTGHIVFTVVYLNLSAGQCMEEWLVAPGDIVMLHPRRFSTFRFSASMRTAMTHRSRGARAARALEFDVVIVNEAGVSGDD